MPDNTPMAAPIELASGYNPFSDEIYTPAEVAPAEQPPVEQQGETPVENTDTQSAQVATETPAQEVTPSFDPNQFIKEKFGFESVEQAEQEFKKLKETPKQVDFEFTDDTSKTLFNAIKEGKVDDVYEILNQQKRLEKLTNSEINPNLAVDIIKTNISNKYKDLTPDEVDLLFYENYNFPQKPEQGYEETDEDYSQKVKNWENTVNLIEKRMVIDAKVIRPELEKLKSELRLPDVYREAESQAQSQEEFENMQVARTNYEKALESQFNSFNGFNVSVKDEDVEIPISFNVAEDERLAIKQDLTDFDSDAYFEGRWFTKEGNPNVQQMMADKYVLENLPKILQKVANEAASQRLLAHLKKTGNYTINQPTPQGTPQPSAASAFEALQAAVWS